MTHLTVRLLGPFGVTLDGEPITGFSTKKARALLAYLVVEADRPHSRQALAGLLWPDFPEASARKSLRTALADVRGAIGDREVDPPFLHISRRAVQFNADSDAWCDAIAFSRLVVPPSDRPQGRESVQSLEEAVALYRGSFLEGFSLADSVAFEDWALIKREQLQRRVLEALRHLAAFYERRGDCERALQYARQQVERDPWQEGAQRQLMQLLALSGQRAAALSQYAAYGRLLAEELGVEPSPETSELYRRINAGELEVGAARRCERVIRGYEIRARVGRGKSGVVYRAYQHQVGREVAVKAILPQYANHPQFIRRFEAEAQLVARLEHPHIVPLYDYWREPDGAYLVMRWLRGGSLGAALERGPWNAEAATRLVDQIAAALAAAHRQGVVHRDIRPANILLDEDGNAYLSDFGIAKDLGGAVDLTQSDALTGSPAYISPEQVQGEPVTSLSDIYSLGVVVFELLTGEHPFPDETLDTLLARHLNESLPSALALRPDLPPAVDEVIQQATAKDPTDRFPDPLALADAFRQALVAKAVVVTPPALVPLPEPTNPYKGLRPFYEADAADFFGREALTEQLVAQLAPSPEPGEAVLIAAEGGWGRGRFLAVVGPSGSGKSSLVRAGLIPALRCGALPGSENWFVVEMFPGAHPLEELEAALLRVAVNPPPTLIEQLQKDEHGLLRAVKRVLPPDAGDQRGSELLLVVDQFEEVFTLVEEEAARTHFLDSLVAAATDPRSRLRVVLTLRADFYDRPLQYRGFGELLRTRMETVLPLSPEELERAISGPAERVDVALEPGLDAKIVADLVDQPGALPLLQYALTELFERRDNHTLTLDAYRSLGGVLGALGRRAEELYTGLDPAGQEATRQLFLRLVTLGEGVEDTRRRVLRAELEALQTSEVLDTVIGQYARYRLLTFDRDAETRAPTVEVAHEALLHEWRRLREWIDESRADLRMQRSLAAATAEWDVAGREPSFLLGGARLSQFESWATESVVALTEDERAFLEASGAERQRREEEKRAQQQRERALERSNVRRLRAIAGVLLAASVVSVFLTLALFRQSRIARTEQAMAEQQARIATARELAAAANENLEIDPERSIWLALYAVNATYSVDKTVLPEAATALHRAIPAARVELNLTGHTDEVWGLAFSPDGTRLATGSHDGTARVWLVAPSSAGDVSTRRQAQDNAMLNTGAAIGEELLSLTGHTDRVNSVAFSPDGERLATASDDGTAKVWLLPQGSSSAGDVATGEELLTVTGHHAPVTHVAFSPECVSPPDGGPERCGARLVTSSSTNRMDGTAKVWDAYTGQELLTLTDTFGIPVVAFSPDGLLLATGGDADTARVWDAATGQELLTLVGHDQPILGLAFSPECDSPPDGGPERCGTRLATASWDETARVWDAHTGEELLTLIGHTNGVNDVAFSPDGSQLATASDDGTVILWDALSGQQVSKLVGHEGLVTNVEFSPDGQRLATAGRDGTVKVWDWASPSRELSTLVGHTDRVHSVAFSPECVHLPGLSLPGSAGECGTRLATTSEDETARVWDATTGRELLTLGDGGQEETPIYTFDITYSPDGRRLTALGADGTPKVWDAHTGQELLALTGHTDQVNNVTFSPACVSPSDGGPEPFEPHASAGGCGSRLATASWDETARVWDAHTGEELLTLTSHAGAVAMAKFSPDGMQLATGSWDGTARVWDATTGQELLTLTVDSDRFAVQELAFSPDGTRLATTSFDWTLEPKPVKVWDTTTGQELLTLSGHQGVVWDILFSPDGTRLVTAGRDTTAKVWDAATGQELWTLAGHASTIWRVAFSPDGALLATASGDGTAKVWDAESGQELVTLTGHTDFVTGVAFSPDGRRLATSSDDGTARVYVLPIDELMDLARSRLTRSLMTEECRRYLHVDECPPAP